MSIRTVLLLISVVGASACGVESDGAASEGGSTEGVAVSEHALLTLSQDCSATYPWGKGLWTARVGCWNSGGVMRCETPMTAAQCTNWCTATCQRPGVASFSSGLTGQAVQVAVCRCK